jgi:ribosomal protein S18 acetylase RimI-like enzyme
MPVRHTARFATVAEEFGLTEQNAPTNGAFMKMDRLQKDFANGDLMFGYVLDGKIVGFVQLAKKSASVFTLEKLAVLPEHRHNGYGERLIEIRKERGSIPWRQQNHDWHY